MQALSSRHILCCRCCHCVAVVGIVLWSCLLHGCSGCYCAVLCCGWGCCMVVVGVVMPCCVAVVMGVSCDMMSQLRLLRCMVVLWLWLLHHMWCRRHCTTCGVVGVALCVVSWVLHCMWCHGCCTTCGVVGVTGITLRGVAGIALHLVLRSQSLCRMVLWLWWLSSCRMGLW